MTAPVALPAVSKKISGPAVCALNIRNVSSLQLVQKLSKRGQKGKSAGVKRKSLLINAVLIVEKCITHSGWHHGAKPSEKANRGRATSWPADAMVGEEICPAFESAALGEETALTRSATL
ncbi:hypothetical protein LHU53_09165 [Rhodoferax sp. U2-2l]|uniref:hypothetical protein n=1 Tax=Rhodoferax sp. U2-2l TaxID=2884000 RepID=UPI001D09AAA3|nr:hypothetical protein [Rhodoferax sp. U2-2l]MCB8747075.1 hypothetical protein [Rhodoferax sp. U2-2l]